MPGIGMIHWPVARLEPAPPGLRGWKWREGFRQGKGYGNWLRPGLWERQWQRPGWFRLFQCLWRIEEVFFGQTIKWRFKVSQPLLDCFQGYAAGQGKRLDASAATKGEVPALVRIQACLHFHARQYLAQFIQLFLGRFQKYGEEVSGERLHFLL